MTRLRLAGLLLLTALAGALDAHLDLFLGVPGTIIVGQPAAALPSRLGPPASQVTAPCAYERLENVKVVTTQQYPAQGLVVELVENRVFAFYLSSNRLFTREGLGVGSTFGEFRRVLDANPDLQRGNGFMHYHSPVPVGRFLSGPTYHHQKNHHSVALLSTQAHSPRNGNIGYTGAASWDAAIVDVIYVRSY